MTADLFLLAVAAAAQAGATQPPLPEAQAPVAAPVPEAAVPEAGAEQPAAETAQPQEVEEPAPELDEEGEEIVVTGTRLRGAVDTDIPPEIQLDRRDIRALGASNIAELLTALAPQTSSGRGRGGGGPVVLLNGRRISGFGEIRNYPPEAIERVDILPEEVALSYGYRADQRVVNIVLRRRFRAVTAELEAGGPTAGGRASYEGDMNVLRLNNNGRWNVDVEYEKNSALFESERNIVQATGGPSDPAVPSLAPFRTLAPATENFSMAGTLNRIILGNVSATVNSRLELSSTESQFGLRSLSVDIPASSPFSTGADETLFRYLPAAGPLTRENESKNAHVGVALNGDVRPWRWSFTGNFDRNSSEGFTGRGLDEEAIQQRISAGDPSLNPRADLPIELLLGQPADHVRTTNTNANAEALASGPVLLLPGGEVRTSVRAGFDTRDFESWAMRSGVVQERDLSRDRTHAQANLDIPLTSRREGFLDPIGDLSINFNGEVEHFSDFGTLRTLGAGVNWRPIEMLSLIASVTDEEGPPGIQQLGDPVLLTPNVRVFDFVRGETVDISRLEGGNPGLTADNRRVLKLGATLRPLSGAKDLSITANYTDTRIDNPIESFPTATPEIEAAFPERFERDASGRLLRIDSRPVNFARSERRELRWGVNLSLPFGPQQQPGRGRFGAGGFGGRPGGAGGAGRAGGAGGAGA
ncbi:TonB-dependent receptor, partial [Sphingomonas parva]